MRADSLPGAAGRVSGTAAAASARPRAVRHARSRRCDPRTAACRSPRSIPDRTARRGGRCLPRRRCAVPRRSARAGCPFVGIDLAGFAAVDRPHNAVDHILLAAHGEAHAVFLDHFLAEGSHHGGQLAGGDVERAAQVVDSGAHGQRADALVGLAAGQEEGVGQQQLELAARQQQRHRRLHLGAPLVEAGRAFGVVLLGVFLPAEQRLLVRGHHHGQQVARIGQDRRGLGQVAQVDLGYRAGQGGRGQLVRQRKGVAVRARQLVDAVEVGRQRDLGAGGQHMCLQVHRQRLRQLRLERAGGNGVARVRQDRGGDQQRVIALAVDLDGGGFGERLGLLGQYVGGVCIVLEQVFQRRVERGLAPVLQQAAQAL